MAEQNEVTQEELFVLVHGSGEFYWRVRPAAWVSSKEEATPFNVFDALKVMMGLRLAGQKVLRVEPKV